MSDAAWEMAQLSEEIDRAKAEGWWSSVEAETDRRRRSERRQVIRRAFIRGLTFQPPPRRLTESADERLLRVCRLLREDIAAAAPHSGSCQAPTEDVDRSTSGTTTRAYTTRPHNPPKPSTQVNPHKPATF